jgi:hypothetical protein
MGSTIDAIKCPKCKYKEASIELYYKTGDETIFCPRCGYFCPRCGYNSEYNIYSPKKPKISGGKGIVYVGFNSGGTSTQFTNKFLNYVKEELKKDNIRNGHGDKATEIYYTKVVDGKWKKFYLIKLIEVSSGNDKEENKNRVV